MTKTSMSTESASVNHERMLKYKTLAVAFSYPNEQGLVAEYDRLFRQKEIWLYGAEYTAENEFQRSNFLSDIAGFYKAFGLETDKDRPDALSCELEFMHYLIHKELYALGKNLKQAEEKAQICLDAQKKFFFTHLYPAAKKIAGAILTEGENSFYSRIAGEMQEFLETESEFLQKI